jgi:hypothetical protein
MPLPLLLQMASGYYVPSFFLHCFAMFGPSLLFGSTYHRLLILLVFSSGPLLSEWLLWGGGQAVRRLEWPSIWCLYSIAQVRMIEDMLQGESCQLWCDDVQLHLLPTVIQHCSLLHGWRAAYEASSCAGAAVEEAMLASTLHLCSTK